MFAGYIAAGLMVFSGGGLSQATDLSAIPRTLQKEPVYQGKPRYCLLVFGRKADTRIWIVQDGKDLYVDANGNGDLTEVGEKYPGNGSFFRIGKLVERDGTIHKNLHIHCQSDGTFIMELHNDNGRRRQYVGMDLMDRPALGDSPENAPIIHFNGPMSLVRYGPIYKMPRMAAPSKSIRYALRVMLGTPGLGKGTFASYDETCSEQLGSLLADIVYPPTPKTGVVIKERVELFHDG
jgi:hypothetical protein